MVQINFIICDHHSLMGQRWVISPRVQPTTEPGLKPHKGVYQHPQSRSTILSLLKQVSVNGSHTLHVICTIMLLRCMLFQNIFVISLLQYLYYFKLVQPFVQSLFENTMDDSESIDFNLGFTVLQLTLLTRICGLYHLQEFSLWFTPHTMFGIHHVQGLFYKSVCGIHHLQELTIYGLGHVQYLLHKRFVDYTTYKNLVCGLHHIQGMAYAMFKVYKPQICFFC